MLNSIISFFTSVAVTVTSFFSGGVSTEITDTLLMRAILEPGQTPRVTLVERLENKKNTFVKTNPDGTFTVTAPEGTSYAKIKAWGGAGGSYGNDSHYLGIVGLQSNNLEGGRGGYVAGRINIEKQEEIKVVLGTVGPSGYRKGDDNDSNGFGGTASRIYVDNKEMFVAGAGSALGWGWCSYSNGYYLGGGYGYTPSLSDPEFPTNSPYEFVEFLRKNYIDGGSVNSQHLVKSWAAKEEREKFLAKHWPNYKTSGLSSYGYSKEEYEKLWNEQNNLAIKASLGRLATGSFVPSLSTLRLPENNWFAHRLQIPGTCLSLSAKFPGDGTYFGIADGKYPGIPVAKLLRDFFPATDSSYNPRDFQVVNTGGSSWVDPVRVINPVFYNGDPSLNTVDDGSWKSSFTSSSPAKGRNGNGAVIIEFYSSSLVDAGATLPVCDLTELIATDTIYNNGSNTTITKKTPSGTKSVKIKAVGAGGGSNPGYNSGGVGGYTEAVFNLGSDEQILATPGSEGRQPGVAFGGASGGGMTKVVTSQGVVWAGGGGGAGGYGGDKGYIAGAGGNGGTPNGTEGGQAWYRYGNPEEGGKGGTQSAGGRGGLANGGDSNGENGRMEQGGQGGHSPYVQYSVSGFNGGGRAGGGGGGGGGYFGGGGGGTPLGYGVSGDNGSGSGGGGGGSSFVSGTPVGIVYTTTNKWWLEGEFGKRKVGLSDGPGGVILEYYGVPASKADKCTDPTKDEADLSLGVALNGRNVNGDFIPKNSKPNLSWSFANIASKDTCSLKKTSSSGTAFETVTGSELSSFSSKITDQLTPALYTFKLECATPVLSKSVSFTVNDGVCVNGATNYPICSTDSGACLNGATNPPLCNGSGDTGGTIPPVTSNVLEVRPQDQVINISYLGGTKGSSEKKEIEIGTFGQGTFPGNVSVSIITTPSITAEESLECSFGGSGFEDCNSYVGTFPKIGGFGTSYKNTLQIKSSKKIGGSPELTLQVSGSGLASKTFKVKITEDVKNPKFIEF